MPRDKRMVKNLEIASLSNLDDLVQVESFDYERLTPTLLTTPLTIRNIEERNVDPKYLHVARKEHNMLLCVRSTENQIVVPSFNTSYSMEPHYGRRRCFLHEGGSQMKTRAASLKLVFLLL